MPREIQKMAFAVLIFSEGFGWSWKKRSGESDVIHLEKEVTVRNKCTMGWNPFYQVGTYFVLTICEKKMFLYVIEKNFLAHSQKDENRFTTS